VTGRAASYVIRAMSKSLWEPVKGNLESWEEHRHSASSCGEGKLADIGGCSSGDSGERGEGKREVAVAEKLLMSGETVVVVLEKGKRSGRGVYRLAERDLFKGVFMQFTTAKVL